MYQIELYNRLTKQTHKFDYYTEKGMYAAFNQIKDDYIMHTVSLEPTRIRCQGSPKQEKKDGVSEQH